MCALATPFSTDRLDTLSDMTSGTTWTLGNVIAQQLHHAPDAAAHWFMATGSKWLLSVLDESAGYCLTGIDARALTGK